GVGTLVVIWAGGRAVVDERLTLGALVAFNGYLAYLTWPTMALGWTLSIVRRGLTSMTRLEEIIGASRAETGFVVGGSGRPGLTGGGLTERRAGSDTPGPSVSDTPVPSVAGAVISAAPGLRFSHLTFAYAGRAPALHDVSFEVEPGEAGALVGPTGSGKTTLGLLVARLWEPPAGTVFIDGRDVRD